MNLSMGKNSRAMPRFSPNFKKKNMKNLAKITSMICFVLLLTSCEKDREIINTPATIETQSEFKGEEDETILVVAVPTIHGQESFTSSERALGITANLVGINVTYNESTVPDLEGHFYFYNLEPGNYVRKIYIGGVLDSSQNYEVDY